MKDFYSGKKVTVTGGSGFIASHLMDLLVGFGANVCAVARSSRPQELHPDIKYQQADLCDKYQCREALDGAQLVFHLAAAGGGFHANLRRQAKLLTANLQLNTTVLDTAMEVGVERYLYTSSIAVYPGSLSDPCEDDHWDGPPHPSEQYYGWAKRMGEIQAQAYYEQFQFPIAIVRPANPYGPADNFDPNKSHVIPALIRRAVVGEDPFVVWGTGKPQRSFIHARDVACGMLFALKEHAVCDPINLASGQSLSIADLVYTILRLTGREDVQVVFDKSKPDGVSRRVPSADKMKSLMSGYQITSIEEGLAETIQWYYLNVGIT